MDLQVLRQYLAFLAQAEFSLQAARAPLASQPAFALYKCLATHSQPTLDRTLITRYLQNFTYNFQSPTPAELLKNPAFELHPSHPPLTQEALLSKGVDLFLNRYSATGSLTFQEFALFVKDEAELPSPSAEVEFLAKKQLFQLLQEELQNLLDCDSFRQAVALHYKNLPDLFESISTQGQVCLTQLQHLFLHSGQRKHDLFYQMLAKRLSLPMDERSFTEWFRVSPNPNKYRQQTKIFYSSVKRKKYEYSRDDEHYNTPNRKPTAVGTTSTKMTKAERLHSALPLSRITRQPGTPPTPSQPILSAILSEEERLLQLKRQLLYQPDYDLELVYERRGQQLQDILNRRYGTCNFTSFVRYLVPQDYEHRYYAFIRYNKHNRLGEETEELVDQLIREEERKEQLIEEWWQEEDREMVFRGYCNPGDTAISYAQLNKYFTERECKLLFDRLDPNKTGEVGLQYFK